MPLTSTLQEFILVGHLRDPLDFTVRDLAHWSDAFAPEFTEFRQLAPAQRAEILQAPQAFQVLDAQIDLPRVLLRSPQTGLYTLLQNDRFACGWSRVEPLGEPADYPGYLAMKDHWRELSSRFDRWHGDRFGGLPQTRLLEVMYVNAYPTEKPDGGNRRLFEVFNFLKSDMRPVNAFNVNWGEALDPANLALGRVTATGGIGVMPPDRRVFAFNFNGLVVSEGTLGAPDALAMFDKLHERILDMRAASITSDLIGR